MVSLTLALVLLACAPALAAPITIEKVHNSLSLDTSGFVVEVPDNAFNGIFQLDASALDPDKLPVSDHFFFTRGVELNMTAYKEPLQNLVKPVLLTFKFDAIDFKRAANMDVSQPLGRFRIACWNETSQSWQELPSTIFWDGSQGAVEAASATGAGRYALLWNYSSTAQLSPMAPDAIRLMVNCQVVQPPAPSFVQNGRTLVPLRFTASMGFTINWDPSEQRIDLYKGTRTLKLWIGQNQVQKDGKASIIDVAPQIVGNYTYVPISFVAQAMGATITWDQLEKTARILIQ